jgi:SAM-dependent methyltransferase
MPTGQSEGYDPTLFAEIAELEDASFWFTERDRLILWALERYAPGMRSFLEVGCGTGHVLAAVDRGFPQARCAGLEPFEEAIEIARRKTDGLELRLGGADSLEPGEDLDAIGCFDVLEHIRDDAGAAAAIAARCAPAAPSSSPSPSIAGSGATPTRPPSTCGATAAASCWRWSAGPASSPFAAPRSSPPCCRCWRQAGWSAASARPRTRCASCASHRPRRPCCARRWHSTGWRSAGEPRYPPAARCCSSPGAPEPAASPASTAAAIA